VEVARQLNAARGLPFTVHICFFNQQQHQQQHQTTSNRIKPHKIFIFQLIKYKKQKINSKINADDDNFVSPLLLIMEALIV